jgi:hypothetical protein
MHPLDQVTSVARFNGAIDDMVALLRSLNVMPRAGSAMDQQLRDAFAALYHSTYRDLRSAATRDDEFRFGASFAGLGDLAAKIVNATKTPNGREGIKPHLHNMVAGSAQMNTVSPSIDAAANKHASFTLPHLRSARVLWLISRIRTPARTAPIPTCY